jgi:hypothetical protein
MFRTASTIRQFFLPRLEEGYCRKTAAALLVLIGPITPVSGNMFNPKTLELLSKGLPAIENVLSEIPKSKLPSTQWIG